MLKEKEEYEVIVSKQDHFGRGIVNIDGMFVFIDGALTGDKCKIEINNVKKNYASAKVIRMVESSNDRVIPDCSYYNICGGCHIMHQDYSKQLEFKELKVKELLERFTNLKEFEIYPILAGDCFNYRNKVILHGNGKELGFYKEKTHELLPIKECDITNKRINDIYKKVQCFLVDNKESFINSIMFRITSLDEIMVVVEGNIEEKEFLSYLEDVNTIYINNELVKGNSYILEDIYGIKFKIYPKSFFQVNYDMMLKMYKLVMDFYKDKNYYKVLDLYCGTGTIGMLVSSYVNHVVGVEIEKSSIESALECMKINKINNIEFICGKVEDNIDSFKDIDSIIVDPPRSGLDKYTIDNILKILPKTITYISCDPATLARDLKMLLEKYSILKIHPVDMFPNTYHVENVVFLERKNNFNNYLALVNKNYVYNEKDFEGINLVKTNDIEGKEILVEEITYQYYLKFKEALEKLGISISITSGYRSLEDQKDAITELKDVYKDQNKLYKKVAPIGASEHHTGLALDITISDKEKYQERLNRYYTEDELKERENKYNIMASICSDYGFILRYPKEKEDITGYSYEPWHFRYVGKDFAKIIMDNNITLEEFLEK